MWCKQKTITTTTTTTRKQLLVNLIGY